MRRSSQALVLLAALAAPPSLAADDPRPTPTPANAVEPSDLSAVAPAFPEKAAQPNREVPFGATPTPAPPAEVASPVPAATPAAVESETPTVSSPQFLAPPASGSAHARAGVVSPKPVAVTHGATSVVTEYQKGRSLTVKSPSGSLVRYRLGKDSVLPDDLAPGRHVLVETHVVGRSRVATKVSYTEGRVVISNVN
jgi:hypothetical protein